MSNSPHSVDHDDHAHADEDPCAYGYHDVGGQAAGPIPRQELDWPFWARQSEAIRTILGDGTRRLVSLDELRRGFENFGEALYNDLGFYERRIISMRNLLIEKGVLTAAEIEARCAAIEASREKVGE